MSETLGVVNDDPPQALSHRHELNMDASGITLLWLSLLVVALQENDQGQFIEQRLIPKEAMYIVMNLAMSDKNWSPLSAALKASLEQSPAVMSVDYVRVWQKPGGTNVGCDPPELPTRNWIACHRDDYLGPREQWNLGGCGSLRTSVS
jgi:hypothetical protein